MNAPNFVQSRADGGVLVVMPLRNIGNFDHEATQREWQAVLDMFKQEEIKHTVLDFGCIAYFGSAVLQYLVLLSRQVSAKQGRLAICNLSAIGCDILKKTGFDRLGRVVPTQGEAMRWVQEDL